MKEGIKEGRKRKEWGRRGGGGRKEGRKERRKNLFASQLWLTVLVHSLRDAVHPGEGGTGAEACFA